MQASPVDLWGQFVLLGAVFFAMYWLVIRPQNKKAREHRQLLSQLQRGDEVLLGSGILGTIQKVGEEVVKVQIADQVDVLVQKQAIGQVLLKGSIAKLH